MKIVPVVITSMTIEFSGEELQALAEVVARVGGDRNSGVRMHTEALRKLLEANGYVYAHNDEYHGSLTFD